MRELIIRAIKRIASVLGVFFAILLIFMVVGILMGA